MCCKVGCVIHFFSLCGLFTFKYLTLYQTDQEKHITLCISKFTINVKIWKTIGSTFLPIIFSHETILAMRHRSREGVKLGTLNVPIRKFISVAGPEDIRIYTIN